MRDVAPVTLLRPNIIRLATYLKKDGLSVKGVV